MALTTLVGGPASDSYCTQAYADTYFGNRANSGKWTAKTSDQQDAILREATRHIDRYIRTRIDDKALLNQKLQWPWYGSAFDSSPDSGSTTTAVDSDFAKDIYPDDYFNGGSIFVESTDDENAPEYELREISDFVRSTGTFTTTAFTAAIGNGDSLWVFPPPPEWMKEAVCEQAYFLVEDSQVETANMKQAGITSKSSEGGTSISIDRSARATWLCAAAFEILEANLPTVFEVRRG